MVLLAISWLSAHAPVWSLLPMMVFHSWFVWIRSIWACLLLLTVISLIDVVHGLGSMLLNRILLMLELIFILCPAAVFSNLSVRCCRPSTLPLRRSISPASCKLQSGRPPLDNDDSEMSTAAYFSVLSANRSSSDCRLRAMAEGWIQRTTKLQNRWLRAPLVEKQLGHQ